MNPPRKMPCRFCGAYSDIRLQIHTDNLTVLRCRSCKAVLLDQLPADERQEDLYSERCFQDRKECFFRNSVADVDTNEENENIRESSEALCAMRELQNCFATPHAKRRNKFFKAATRRLRSVRDPHFLPRRH